MIDKTGYEENPNQDKINELLLNYLQNPINVKILNGEASMDKVGESE